MPVTPDLSKTIYAEQLRLLYEALPLSVFITLFNAIILVLVQWSVLDHVELLIWLGLMSVVLVGRAYSLFAYKRRDIDAAQERFELAFNMGTFAAALMWAAAIVFLFPEQIEYQVFMAFVVGGMCAGAATSLSYLRTPFLLYMPILLVPLAVRFFIEGETINTAMGVMVIAFMVVMLTSSSRIYRSNLQNTTLRFEAIHIQRALRESEGKYQHIFEAVPLGIAHYNMNGQLLDHNSIYADLSGMDDPSSREWNLVKSSPDIEFSEAVATSIYKGHARYEGHASAIGGSPDTDIRVYLAAINNGDDANEGVAIIEDISEDKRLEKAKNEFISSVNHELRTPLTSIMAVVGLMKMDKLGPVPGEMKPMLDIADRNSKRLLSLINDLLDMSNIESGDIQLDMQTCRILPVIKSAVEEMYPLARQKDVELQLECSSRDTCIKVDKGRYAQVVCNLLSNAIKFSPGKSVVVVRSEELHNKLRVSVIDNGPGIPEDFQAEMFDRFTQNDASDTKAAGGSGLGLNISSELVTMMSGKLGYETKTGVGSSFYIDFNIVEC